MSTNRVKGAFASITSEASLSDKESKDKDRPMPSTDSVSHSPALLDGSIKASRRPAFVHLESICHQHALYKLIDLDLKQNEDEIKEQKVRLQFRNVRGNEALFSSCFNRLTHIQSLCIDATSIDLFFCSALEKFIHKNSHLLDIHISTYKIKNENEIIDIFNRYSSLEQVTITSIGGDLNNINEGCQPYIERNKEVRGFIKKIKNHIANLPLIEEKNSETKSEEEYLIKLAPIYEEVWLACANGFIESEYLFRLIANDNIDLIDKITQAKSFHPLIAAQEGNLDKLRKIFNIHRDLDVNRMYKYYQIFPRRLIDLANEENVIQYLVNEHKVDGISNEIFESPPFSGWNARRTEPSNLLLRLESTGKRFDLRKLNSFIDIVYDALAFVVTHHPEHFQRTLKEHCTSIKIDINKPIVQGIYTGYTLFQLSCLKISELERETLFLIQDEFKKSSSDEVQAVLHSRFPLNKLYRACSGLTVLQYLTYHLHIPFLFEIMPASMLFNESNLVRAADESSQYFRFNGYSLFQLFIQGVLDNRKDDKSIGNMRQNLSKYFHLLKPEKGNHFDLCLRDADNSTELPIFCYAAKNSRFLANDIFFIEELLPDFFSLDRRFDCLEYKGITSFHASILFGTTSFCSLLLLTMTRSGKANHDDIIRLLSERINHVDRYNNCTLFQVAILRNLASIFTISSFPIGGVNLSSLINEPYPSESHEYAGWTPIQVSIQFVKKGYGESNLFESLLKVIGIDLDVCYPNNIYLRGLSLLQAILLPVKHDPYKYATTGRNFGEPSIRTLIKKLNPDQINFVCQERDSPFYGMTALHISVANQDEQNAAALLDSDKTDYTVLDYFKRTPLEIARYLRNSDIINSIENCAKKYPQHKTRYFEGLKYTSEVCPSYSINRDRWIVSIARENNSEHAFLIFEGLKQEEKQETSEAIVWVAQLYLPKSSNFIAGKAKVDFGSEREMLHIGKEKTKNLLPLVKNKLKDIIRLSPSTMLFYVSAYVESKTCQRLIKSIEDEKSVPVSYNIFGRGAISGTSKKSHNCVSWAIDKYNSVVAAKDRLPKSWNSYIYTSAKGFLNEHFIYVADTTISRNLLKEQVSVLFKNDKRRLKKHDTLLARQNIQWGLLAAITCMLLCNTLEYPKSGGYKLLLSLVVGGAIFCLFNSSPREREYNEDAPEGNRLT